MQVRECLSDEMGSENNLWTVNQAVFQGSEHIKMYQRVLSRTPYFKTLREFTSFLAVYRLFVAECLYFRIFKTLSFRKIVWGLYKLSD
jgi:hypothetical protein